MKSILAVLVFILLCLALSVVLLLTLVSETARAQMPFGQEEMASWMLGTPWPMDDHQVEPERAAGPVGWADLPAIEKFL